VVSRLVVSLAQNSSRALAGDAAPGAESGLLTADLDATIVIVHPEKEQVAPTGIFSRELPLLR
jgi:hypothetical protein